MKNILVFLTISFILFSCIEDPEYSSKYKITNNSNYLIKFECYPNNVFDSFEINSGSNKVFSDISRGSFNDYFPFEYLDSIKVTYNNNVFVYHGSTLYNLNKNLLNRNSFINSMNNTYSKEFIYNFTEDDYQEALIYQ